MNLTASRALYSPEPAAFLAQTFIAGAAIGLALGLLAYLIGRMRGNRKLGTIAVPVCFLSGLILGAVLAIPVAIAFSVAIIMGGDPTLNKILDESARGNTDLLHQIINGGSDRADGGVRENPAIEEQTEPEERIVSASEEPPEPRRPLVEKLFS